MVIVTYEQNNNFCSVSAFCVNTLRNVFSRLVSTVNLETNQPSSFWSVNKTKKKKVSGSFILIFLYYRKYFLGDTRETFFSFEHIKKGKVSNHKQTNNKRKNLKSTHTNNVCFFLFSSSAFLFIFYITFLPFDS
jgi:hypothetical protein